jgi:hypothetical protein
MAFEHAWSIMFASHIQSCISCIIPLHTLYFKEAGGEQHTQSKHRLVLEGMFIMENSDLGLHALLTQLFYAWCFMLNDQSNVD